MSVNRSCFVSLVVLASLFGGPRVFGAERQAEAKLSCYSVRFQRGQGPFGLYTLDLTSVDGVVNGELAPASGQYTHGCYFLLNDPSGFDPAMGIMNLDVPLESDANDNGFADFFEVSQDGSGNSSGVYMVPGIVPQQTFTARWTRGAESPVGTCVLNLGSYGEFTHTFEIIEYKGPLPYEPGATNIVAGMTLPQTGNPESVLGGRIEFRKVSSDRFNQMQLQAGSLTNQAQETFTFGQDLFQRDAAWPTNYYGFLELDNDGDSSTFYPYGQFLLSIDDPNDSDSDGIPDFSDDPAPATRPSLSLTTTQTNLVLQITGEKGARYLLQQAVQPSGLWQTASTIALTNTPQEIVLPFPTESIVFWRLQGTQ